MDRNMYKYKHGGLHREQELKEPGGRRSWRDEARARLVEALGRTGERLGEGLLGESEEDKYLEFLQRTYGSELPRDEEGNIDVPESRPLRESFLDPSDLGMSDKLLMLLSGGGSLMPRAALTAAGTETGMLLGDAKGEYDKGNTTGAGIMAGLAGLPPAVAAGLNNKTFMDLGREATSGIGSFIRNMFPGGQRTSMVTPEGVDVPLYFSKGSGSITGGGSSMKNQERMNELIKRKKDLIRRSNERGEFFPDEVYTIDAEIEKLMEAMDNPGSITGGGSSMKNQERMNELTERKNELIKNHEAMTERMPADEARRYYPQSEIDQIDDELYDLQLPYDPDFNPGGVKTGTPSADNTTKLRDLENKLYEKEAVRNTEYGDMSVKNLGKLDIEIGKLKAEINALKG